MASTGAANLFTLPFRTNKKQRASGALLLIFHLLVLPLFFSVVDRNNLAPVVISAHFADAVRRFQRMALRATHKINRIDLPVRAMRA